LVVRGALVVCFGAASSLGVGVADGSGVVGVVVGRAIGGGDDDTARAARCPLSPNLAEMARPPRNRIMNASMNRPVTARMLGFLGC
jgi:hypothetical protein